MRVNREISKMQSVFIDSQPASEVIDLKQLRDGMNVLSLRVDMSPIERGNSLLKLEWSPMAAACQDSLDVS
jgi:hypothetical protein